MTMNLLERIEKALSDFTSGRASMHVPPLDTDVDMVLTDCQSQLTALTSQLESVVAENAVSNDRLQKLIQIINNADNSYCMCGDAMRNHAHGGCGHPTGMFDYHHSQWLESAKETPATAAFLAEVRASGIDQWIASRDGRWNGTTKEAERFSAKIRQEAK